MLAGLGFAAPGFAQIIAQGGQLEVVIYDGGGEVELVPLDGGSPPTICTGSGGDDCKLIGMAGAEV